MTPTPDLTDLKIHRRSRCISLHYSNSEEHTLSFEFLRVHSPSAEVRGHGEGQEVLQTGKKNVLINGAEAAGNYAVRFFFDDGHDSGIYSWEYLYQLATEQERLWQEYLDKLESAGASREPDPDKPVRHQPVQTFNPSGKP